MDDFRLERFVAAQEASYASAFAEVQAGRKVTHWMWFVFPQIAGLGSSAMAAKYALSGLDEARAYLRHPVLGPRLLEISRAVVESRGHGAEEVFGFDAVKLRSSMTLFGVAAPEQEVFQQVLDLHFGGEPDPATVARV